MKLKELQKLEVEFPEFADDNSPTKRVGGAVTKDFETVILLANVNLCDLKNANMNGELSIFFSSGKKQKIVSKDIHIGQNGYSFIHVSNLIDDFKYANTTKSISCIDK